MTHTDAPTYRLCPVGKPATHCVEGTLIVDTRVAQKFN